MAIKVRPLEDDDMVEVVGWFQDKNWKIPPTDRVLPELGYVAEEKKKPLAVAWLYVTNSGVAIVDWLATHPRAGSRGIFAVKKLIEHIEESSQGKVTALVHYTSNDKLAGFLKGRCGFEITSKAHVCVRRQA